MSMYWDFRSILDVYPDGPRFTCVSIIPKGRRCGQCFFSRSDLPMASRILNEMATHKGLASTYQYLEELAGLTLCPRWHRNPGQVSEVADRWRTKIQTYEARLRSEREKASTIASERALAKMRRTAKEMAVKLEEEEYTAKAAAAARPEILREKTTNRSLKRGGSFVPTVKMEDPFTENDKTDSTKENLFTKSLPKVQKAFDSSAMPDDLTISKLGGRTADQNKNNVTSHLPSNNSGLPSPPSSPPDSNAQKFAETKLEQCLSVTPTKILKAATNESQSFTVTKTSSIKVEPADAKASFTSEQKTTIEAFNSNFQAKTESSVGIKQKSVGMKEARSPIFEFGKGKQAAFYPFDEKMSRLPLTPADTPLSTKEMGFAAESLQSTAASNITAQYKIPSKSFEFDTPLKLSFAIRLPEKPSTVWNEFNTGSETKQEKDMANTRPDEGGSEHLYEHHEPVEEKLTPQAPIKGTEIKWSKDPRTPETKLKSSKISEESYGYATITPPSTRQRTYLPARQQHGLMTPPETPEIAWEKVPFVVSFGEMARPPSLAIPQNLSPKLPGLPTQENAERCASCGFNASAGEYGCLCDNDDSGRETRNTGCLYALGLGDMSKRASRRVNAVKTRVSEVVHRRKSEGAVDE